MAESALEKLMRLAKEKKAASAAPVVATQPVSDNNEPAIAASAEGGASADTKPNIQELEKQVIQIEQSVEDIKAIRADINKKLEEMSDEQSTGVSESTEQATATGELESQSVAGDRQLAQQASGVEGLGDSGSSGNTSPASDHPLAMQFAELEAALLAQQPEFKTILRQIHRHLGQEPELVTQMTEQEIQLIVSGLVVFANAEIVAPAAEKTAKAKIAAAKKQPISADDL